MLSFEILDIHITMAFFLGGDSILTNCAINILLSNQGTEVVFFLTSPEGIQALIAASGDAELLVRLGMCNRRSHCMSCCVEAVN